MAPRPHTPTPGSSSQAARAPYAREGTATTQAASPPPRPPPPPPKKQEERRARAKNRRKNRRWTDVLEESGTLLIHLADDMAVPPLSACATMLTPALARNGLHLGKKPEADKNYHARAAALEVVQEMEEEKKKEKSALENELLRDVLIAERFVVSMGQQFLDASPGPHFTFIDPRRAYWRQIVKQALRMSAAFGPENKDRVVFSIPATQDGIFAARILARHHGIRTNMLYVTSLQQAQWCIEAGATAVTFSCLPMLVIEEEFRPFTFENKLPEDHPCIKQIQATVAYVHQNRCDTQVIVADAVGITNLEALLGIDFFVVGAGTGVLDWPSDTGGFGPFNFRRVSTSAPHIRAALAAPYPPTERVSTTTNFQELMDPFERKFMQAVVDDGLHALRENMHALDRALEPFTMQRLKLQFLQIEFPEDPAPIPIGHAEPLKVNPRPSAKYKTKP